MRADIDIKKRYLYFLVTIIIIFIGITYVIAQTSKSKTWSSQADFVAGTLEDAQVNLDLTGTCDAKRYLSTGYNYPGHETDADGTCKWCSGSGTDGVGDVENIANGQDPFSECTTASPPSSDSCKADTCDGTGKCGYLSAGEQSQPACKRCSGSSYDTVNIADNTGDSEGSNKCDDSSGTCYRCLSGSCTYQTSSQDLFGECTQGSTASDGCRSNNCGGSGYSCGVQSSGDGGCPTCQGCSDSDIACENTYSAYNEDSGCTAQCTGCSGGSCVNIPDGQYDNYGSNQCTASHYRCNGGGSCTNPLIWEWKPCYENWDVCMSSCPGQCPPKYGGLKEWNCWEVSGCEGVPRKCLCQYWKYS